MSKWNSSKNCVSRPAGRVFDQRAMIVGLALGLAGCADSSDNIAASYVSPLVYQDYSCSQLGAELGRVTARVAEVAGVQDSAASDDAALMGVGLVLFWPTLFFLEGDTGREAELGRLKGEVDAIERAATRKNCTAVLGDLERRRAAAEAARKKKNRRPLRRKLEPVLMRQRPSAGEIAHARPEGAPTAPVRLQHPVLPHADGGDRDENTAVRECRWARTWTPIGAATC